MIIGGESFVNRTLFHCGNISPQVVSRGQIQYWNSEKVSLAASALPVEDSILVAPLKPPFSRFTVRGTLQLSIELPPTVSPTVKVRVELQLKNTCFS